MASRKVNMLISLQKANVPKLFVRVRGTFVTWSMYYVLFKTELTTTYTVD